MQQCFKLITQSKMIKLFKNIRKNLIAEGKTTNYLKYAIGEIVLVVIGILIALQINNWNENRKTKKEIIYSLEKISADLNRDINYLGNIINEGEKLDSLANLIIAKKYNLGNMSDREKIKLFLTGLQYSPFNYTTAGYERLEKLDGSIPAEYNDVFEQINTHYNSVAPVLIKLNDKQSDEIESHHHYLAQNEAWYSKFRLGEFTKEAEDFFTSNPIYINWITQFKISQSGRKNGVLHALRGSCIATLLKVNKTLGKSNQKIEKLVKKVPDKFSNISGSYYSKLDDNNFKVEIIDGFLLVDGMVYSYEGELEFKSFGFGIKLKFIKENNSYTLYTNDFFKDIEATQQK